MTDPRKLIRSAIQQMDNSGDKYRREYCCDADIFRNLERVKESNSRGKSVCGNASNWLEEFLPLFLKEKGLHSSVFKVTSSIQNGCFHHFNMVKIENMPPVICDLTASQYFNRPFTALKGETYFVGTRQELHDIITNAQQNSWDAIQHKFQEHQFKSLWDVDYLYYKDWDFRMALIKFLKEEIQDPCLMTESFHYPMEITWGDKRSHLLNRHNNQNIRAKLTKTFELANISDLTESLDPKIPNLITSLSSDKFSLKDSPKLDL